MRDHLGTNIAPKAVKILDEIMSDSKVQPRVRVYAAKALLDRAGYATGEDHKRAPVTPDAMESMSIEELQKFIKDEESKIEREINQRAENAILINAGEEFLA